MRGTAATGRFHIQVTASSNPGGSDALLFHMIPHLDVLDPQLANDDPSGSLVMLRGIAETHGDRTSQVPDNAGSWIRLSPSRMTNSVARAHTSSSA